MKSSFNRKVWKWKYQWNSWSLNWPANSSWKEDNYSSDQDTAELEEILRSKMLQLQKEKKSAEDLKKEKEENSRKREEKRGFI